MMRKLDSFPTVASLPLGRHQPNAGNWLEFHILGFPAKPPSLSFFYLVGSFTSSRPSRIWSIRFPSPENSMTCKWKRPADSAASTSRWAITAKRSTIFG